MPVPTISMPIAALNACTSSSEALNVVDTFIAIEPAAGAPLNPTAMPRAPTPPIPLTPLAPEESVKHVVVTELEQRIIAPVVGLSRGLPSLTTDVFAGTVRAAAEKHVFISGIRTTPAPEFNAACKATASLVTPSHFAP